MFGVQELCDTKQEDSLATQEHNTAGSTANNISTTSFAANQDSLSTLYKIVIR